MLELGRRFYLDANIIVYCVQGFPEHQSVLLELLTALDAGKAAACTSALSLAEVLVKPKIDKNLTLENAFKLFLQPTQVFELIPISDSILETAAEIRASSNLKLPDAIHLATCQNWGDAAFLTNDH